MRNMLAITILMLGLAGAAVAQDQPSKSDATLKAETPSTDNKKEQQKESPKTDCHADQQSSATQQAPCRDCEKSQTPEQAPQNAVEYGG
jgi:hypothetical protein